MVIMMMSFSQSGKMTNASGYPHAPDCLHVKRIVLSALLVNDDSSFEMLDTVIRSNQTEAFKLI